MATFGILRCSWCNEPIEHRASRGPAPSYCCSAHRVAACRARKRFGVFADETAARESVVEREPAAGTSSPKDDEVAHAILEAKVLAGTLFRLGREARPQFAWRCAEIAEALAAALESVLGES